jgi:hypothetical protein
VVVASGSWVVEQARAQAKLASTEMGLDGDQCSSMTRRFSWRMRKTVGGLLRDVLHGGLAWG